MTETLDTYCPYCDKLVTADIEEIIESYVVRGKPITVTSKVPICPHCDCIIGDSRTEEANLELVYKIYEEEYNEDPRFRNETQLSQ